VIDNRNLPLTAIHNLFRLPQNIEVSAIKEKKAKLNQQSSLRELNADAQR
jgi:hypothetical protein